jgi:hypothetical protein
MAVATTVNPPSYLDITLINLRRGSVCGCGRRLNPGDRVGWARSTQESVCIPCVKRALWEAVEGEHH